MKKLFLINPPSPDGFVYIRDIQRHGRRSSELMIWPQTNLASIAAMFREDFEVTIFDCIASKISWGELEETLVREKPDYALVEVISSTLSNDMEVVKVAKQQGAITMAVGPHVTELPEESLKRFKELDFVLLSEVEETARELVDFCESGGNDYSQIQGLVFCKEGGLPVRTAERPWAKLDDLPIPSFDLLPLNEYRTPFLGNYTFIVTSRGCPYPCTFCRQIITFKGKFRQKSAQRVVEEIKVVKELGVTNLLLHADTFTVNKKWVLEFCDLVVQENLNIKWACNTHIKSIDREIAVAMKKAGCWMIAPGVESGAQEVLDAILKGTKVQEIRDTVNMLHEVGIEVWAYMVFGFPGETRETIKQSIAFSKELPFDIVHFGVGAPYPGTPFYNQAKENGWLTSETWEDFDQNYSCIVEYPDLKASEIARAVKRAYLSFYCRPKPIWKITKEMFGSLRNIKAVLGIVRGLLRPPEVVRKTAKKITSLDPTASASTAQLIYPKPE